MEATTNNNRLSDIPSPDRVERMARAIWGVRYPTIAWGDADAIHAALTRDEARAALAEADAGSAELRPKITALLQADPVCNGRVGSATIDAIADLLAGKGEGGEG